MKGFILFCCLAALTLSYSFNLQSTSQCQAYDSTYNVCSRWSQSGTIDQNGGECFHGDTLVKEFTRGFIKMSQVNIGDKLLSMQNGEEAWSTVQAWHHKIENRQTKYVSLNFPQGSLLVTGKHNIAVKKQQTYEYKYSIEVALDQPVYPSNAVIQSVDHYIADNAYGPRTSLGSYFVYVDENTPILAHDFAHVRNPEFFKPIFDVIYATCNIFMDEYLNEDGMNSIDAFLKENLGFVVE